jgi:hypothetical protein
MSKNGNLKAIIEFEGKKAIFEGAAQEVWKSINRFLSEMQPKNVILSEMIVRVDINELLSKLKAVIQIDKDVGPVLSDKLNVNALNDTERVLLTLLMKKVVSTLGYSDEETCKVKEVEKESKAKNAGVLLSQLVAQKIVQNVAEPGKKGTYKITDYGVQWFVPRLLEKISG